MTRSCSDLQAFIQPGSTNHGGTKQAFGIESNQIRSRPAFLSSNDNGAAKSIIHAISRGFSCLILSASKLDSGQDAKSRRAAGAVVHGLAVLFREILSLLTDVALDSAERELLATQERQAGKVGVGQDKSQKPQRSQEVEQSLCQAITLALSNLDAHFAIHNEIFEAFLFVLIRRVGSCLHMAQFSHVRRSNIADDIKETEKVMRGQQNDDEKLIRMGMNIEGPFLVSALKHALVLASCHFNPKSESRKSPLSSMMKDRLQRTLVNAIFGTHKNDDFMDCLSMPMKTSPPPRQAESEESNSADRFKQELWNLLGWQILAKEWSLGQDVAL